MIEITDVTKSYGRLKAVDGVSISVDEGSALVLIGENGAGKSTLLKCVVGILDFEGEIKICGKPVKKDPKGAKALIGYVPQEPAFYEFTVDDTLGFFGSLRGVPRSRANAVKEMVGLAEHSWKKASELSGGLKQRLSFAIAMLSDPPIMVLDEPTSNLDAQGREEFLSMAKEFMEDGKTILFSSHRMDEVEFLATRVVSMKSGKVVQEGLSLSNTEGFGGALSGQADAEFIRLSVAKDDIEKAREVLSSAGFTFLEKGGGYLLVENHGVKNIKASDVLSHNGVEASERPIDKPPDKAPELSTDKSSGERLGDFIAGGAKND